MYLSSSDVTPILRIGTYNILNPIFEQKYSGKNTWDKRLANITENILFSNCDILCLQEVGETNYNDLIKNPEINKRYQSTFIPHISSNPEYKEGRDGTAFFYKPSKIKADTLVKSNRDLRPTHRSDYYVDLKYNIHKTKTAHFRLASLHVDASERESGNQQVAALLKDVLETTPLHHLDFVVVCGDFNEGNLVPNRPRFQLMQNAGFITDGSLVSTRSEAVQNRNQGHIDWIFVRKLSSLSFELKQVDPLGNSNASDHKLIMTDLLF